MRKSTKTRLVAAILPAFAVAAACPPLHAEEKFDLMSSEALHRPERCDLKLRFDQLSTVRAPKAKRRFKVSYAMVSLAGYYYQATAYGALKAAQEAGVDLKLVASQGFSSQADQVTKVRTELAQGIDGLLINPVDVNGAVSVVEQALSAGKPTVAIGTNVNTDKVDRVVQDSYDQGVAAADYLARTLPNGGQGIVMGGPATATWAARRVAGFQDGLKKHPNIRISSLTNQDVDAAAGLQDFTNAAHANPKVDWIYVTYNLQLPPDSVPFKYSHAVYVAGGLEPLMIDALKAGNASAGLPTYPVAVGYIGMARLIERLNGGGGTPSMVCLPADEIVTAQGVQKADLSNELYPRGWRATAN